MEVLGVEHPLQVRRGRIIVPNNGRLMADRIRIGSRPGAVGVPVVVMPCDEAVAAEARRWADETMHPRSRCRLYGCWELKVHDVRIDKRFMGISAYFTVYIDAFQFKLSWCEMFQGTFGVEAAA